MPRSFHPFRPRRPERPSSPGLRRPEVRSGRSDAPADPPLEFPSLELDKTFSFDGALAARLLRREVNPKEAFTIRDASGTFFRASLKELGDHGGTAIPYERLAVSPEPSIELTLACAVLARQRMLFVAQKATELGVSRIIPLLTEHSVPRSGLEHEKSHAWPGQVIRAAKQCRRSSLPSIDAPTTFNDFLSSPDTTGHDLFLCLDNVGSPSKAPSTGTTALRKILLLVGPEGGFSQAERDKLDGKAQSWVLGGRVLRAETAVVVGLAVVQSSWGDFRAPSGSLQPPA